MIVKLGLFEFVFLVREMNDDYISEEGLAALYDYLKNQDTIDVEDFRDYKELHPFQVLEAHLVHNANNDFIDAKLKLDSSHIMDYVCYVDNSYGRKFIVKLR